MPWSHPSTVNTHNLLLCIQDWGTGKHRSSKLAGPSAKKHLVPTNRRGWERQREDLARTTGSRPRPSDLAGGCVGLGGAGGHEPSLLPPPGHSCIAGTSGAPQGLFFGGGGLMLHTQLGRQADKMSGHSNAIETLRNLEENKCTNTYASSLLYHPKTIKHILYKLT